MKMINVLTRNAIQDFDVKEVLTGNTDMEKVFRDLQSVEHVMNKILRE